MNSSTAIESTPEHKYRLSIRLRFIFLVRTFYITLIELNPRNEKLAIVRRQVRVIQIKMALLQKMFSSKQCTRACNRESARESLNVSAYVMASQVLKRVSFRTILLRKLLVFRGRTLFVTNLIPCQHKHTTGEKGTGLTRHKVIQLFISSLFVEEGCTYVNNHCACISLSCTNLIR